MMNSFDFSSIEEMDPSIADGYRVIYDRECPFELRVQESADSPQQVRVGSNAHCTCARFGDCIDTLAKCKAQHLLILGGYA